jgi:hypothetical protein
MNKKNNSELRKNICDTNLFKKNKREYGTTFRDHFLEQYKVAIQGVDYTSKWKHIVNNYYLTINTVLLAAIGFSASQYKFALPDATHQLIPVIGALIAVAWGVTLRNYNNVLASKFSILHCIEEHLPLAPYKTEWELMKSVYGKHPRRAFVDGLVPMMFFVFYILIYFFV